MEPPTLDWKLSLLHHPCEQWSLYHSFHVSLSCPRSTLPCTNKCQPSYKKTKNERSQEEFFFSNISNSNSSHCWGRIYALQEDFNFVFHMRKKHTAGTDWNRFFWSPWVTSLSLRTEDAGLFSFSFFWFICFVFFVFSDRDLCTKQELRVKDLQRLTNPNLSAKVHNGAKCLGGERGGLGRVGEARSNIQHTKKKSYLKVALSFCCTREEGNYAMWG